MTRPVRHFVPNFLSFQNIPSKMQPNTTNYMENTNYSGFSCINVDKMDYTHTVANLKTDVISFKPNLAMCTLRFA